MSFSILTRMGVTLIRIGAIAQLWIACSRTDHESREPIRQHVTTVSVWPDTVTLTEGDTLRFRALYRSAGNTLVDNAAVAWTTSDSAIAFVSNGLVVAGRRGSATIVASSGSIAGFAHVNVVGMRDHANPEMSRR